MVPLQKRGFLNNTRKASKWLSTAGGHIGAPGEATWYDYSGNIIENDLFSVQPFYK